ncbi:MAG: GNAT family N-acetyltransferase [Chloroflexota bacterium]|nr:GNAT family N-acetyltransferase [Chloroflexota bacterium]
MTPATDRGQTPEIEPIAPADVQRLRLGWWSRLDLNEAGRLVRTYPGLSVWMPGCGEYLLAGPWRHRPEIVHMVELSAVRYPVELTRAAIRQAQIDGRRLFLAVEMSEKRQQSFYDQAGLRVLEDVLSFEWNGPLREYGKTVPGEFSLVRDLDERSMEALIAIDWSAFPFLWRNSVQEFHDYAGQIGVELHILQVGDQPVGYIGLTSYAGWGHIDRVAVQAGFQGKGFGRALVHYAVRRLASLGATRIGLSTQRRNDRSQRLYSDIGFRRHEAGDYRIYGTSLWPDDELAELVSEMGR